jgi:16S rRNA processing protein RimM
MNLIEIGIATEIDFGKGKLFFKPREMHADSLKGVSSLWLSFGEEEPVELRIRRMARHKRYFTVEFDPNHVRAGKDGLQAEATAFVQRADLPQTGTNEYYFSDLKGCTVSGENGECFGTVTGMVKAGSSEVLVVTDGEVERMVPMAGGMVRRVDLASRTITVRPIQGLFQSVENG